MQFGSDRSVIMAFLGTYVGLFLGYTIQSASRGIDSATDLMVSLHTYNVTSSWLSADLDAAKDMASWMLWAVAFGAVLLAVSTLSFWKNSGSLARLSVRDPVFLLFGFFYVSWLIQPIVATRELWTMADMAIPTVEGISLPSTEIRRLQVEVIQLWGLRFFGVRFMQALLTIAMIFLLWLSVSKATQSHGRKRIISLLAYASIAILPAIFLQFVVNRIELPPRLLVELRGTWGVVDVSGNVIFYEPWFGFDFTRDFLPIAYDLLFSWGPLVVWLLALVKSITEPLSPLELRLRKK